MAIYLNLVLNAIILGILQKSVSLTEVLKPRGVPLSKTSFYQADKAFTCLDGSNTIPFQMVNDDYCDCSDGTDEPGTSACPNGIFHCENNGHIPKDVVSALVNDGVCDCCDGGDEYRSRTECKNTCEELGRKVRDAAERQAAEMNEGYKVREGMVEEAKQLRENKQIELTDLQKEKEDLQSKKEELETAKLNAEEPEKAAKEAHEKWWEETKAQRDAEKQLLRIQDAFKDLDVNSDGIVSLEELILRMEFDVDSDGSVTREELQELVGDDKLHYDYDTFHEKIWDEIKDVYVAPAPPTPSPPPPPPIEDITPPDEDYPEERDDEGGEDEVDDYDPAEDEEDEVEDEAPGRKLPQIPEGVVPDETMPEYGEDTKKLIEIADEARRAYNDANAQLNNVESKISDIESTLSSDMGPNDEYLKMEKECVEFSDDYTYRICLFNKVTQKPRGGGQENNLGTWKGWTGPDSDKYSEMTYHNGGQCWNGPARSTQVKVRCGKENRILSASEPNRCEYLMELATPAACVRQVTADEVMSAQQGHGLHDEL